MKRQQERCTCVRVLAHIPGWRVGRVQQGQLVPRVRQGLQGPRGLLALEVLLGLLDQLGLRVRIVLFLVRPALLGRQGPQVWLVLLAH